VACWNAPGRLSFHPPDWWNQPRWFGEWRATHVPPVSGTARTLWRTLEDAGAFDHDAEETRRVLGDIVFVGHATALYCTGTAAILVDPFLLPRSPRYPPEYQPITPAEFGQIDAILITHSHPDHFDLGSLSRFGADLPIYVPGSRAGIDIVD